MDTDAAVAAPSGNRAGSIRAVDADARIERRVERKKERAVAFLIGVFVSPVCRYIGSVEFEGALRGLAVVAGFLLSAVARRAHGERHQLVAESIAQVEPAGVLAYLDFTRHEHTARNGRQLAVDMLAPVFGENRFLRTAVGSQSRFDGRTEKRSLGLGLRGGFIGENRQRQRSNQSDKE